VRTPVSVSILSKRGIQHFVHLPVQCLGQSFVKLVLVELIAVLTLSKHCQIRCLVLELAQEVRFDVLVSTLLFKLHLLVVELLADRHETEVVCRVESFELVSDELHRLVPVELREAVVVDDEHDTSSLDVVVAQILIDHGLLSQSLQIGNSCFEFLSKCLSIALEKLGGSDLLL